MRNYPLQKCGSFFYDRHLSEKLIGMLTEIHGVSIIENG